MGETYPASLRETVKLLYFQGLKTPVICSQTGVKPGTLKTWANRYKWNRQVSELSAGIAKGAMPAVIASAQSSLEAVSQRVRGKAANKLETIADRLLEMPAGKRIHDLKAQSEVLESLTRASKPVFGWGEETMIGVIGVGLADLSETPAIDVSATPINADCLAEPGGEPTQIADSQSDSPTTDKPV